MRIPRPRSLNGLILVGFGLVGLPLLVAVLWALFNLDRLAEQSEQLVVTGVAAAENNRLLTAQVGSFERAARQYQVLRNDDSLQLMRQDVDAVEVQLGEMAALTELAGANRSPYRWAQARDASSSRWRAVRRIMTSGLPQLPNSRCCGSGLTN